MEEGSSTTLDISETHHPNESNFKLRKLTSSKTRRSVGRPYLLVRFFIIEMTSGRKVRMPVSPVRPCAAPCNHVRRKQRRASYPDQRAAVRRVAGWNLVPSQCGALDRDSACVRSPGGECSTSCCLRHYLRIAL